MKIKKYKKLVPQFVSTIFLLSTDKACNFFFYYNDYVKNSAKIWMNIPPFSLDVHTYKHQCGQEEVNNTYIMVVHDVFIMSRLQPVGSHVN